MVSVRRHHLYVQRHMLCPAKAASNPLSRGVRQRIYVIRYASVIRNFLDFHIEKAVTQGVKDDKGEALRRIVGSRQRSRQLFNANACRIGKRFGAVSYYLGGNNSRVSSLRRLAF